MAATLLKYLGAALLLGSVFWLVLAGKVDANLYVNIVIGGLTGLGIYHTVGGAPAARPTNPTSSSTGVQS